WSGHRRCRSFVLLQLTRRVRRVAVALRRVRDGCGNNRRIVFSVSLAVPLAVAVTRERRSGRQSSDAEYEHAGAHEPQFHVSPSFPSLVLLPDLTIGMSRALSTHLQTRRAASRPPFFKKRYSSLDLGAQLGPETLFQSQNDAVAELGGVLVGERAVAGLEGHREGDRLLPRPGLGPAVDVERLHLAELWAGGLLCRPDQLPGGDLLRNDEGEVLTHGRECDDVLVDHEIGHTFDERVDVELERAPVAGQLGIAQRGDPPLGGASSAPGRRELVGGSEARLDGKRGIQAFDRPLREREVSLGDSG